MHIMNLLHALYGAYLNGVKQGAVKKRIRLGFALPINGLITMSKPLNKPISFLAGKTFCQFQNTIIIKGIRGVLFTIGSS